MLLELCIDANDPLRLARFWGDLLRWDVADGGRALQPTDDTGFGIRFQATSEPKLTPNQLHPDLTSESTQAQRETVERALQLGATHLDVGQLPEQGHVVLADPEGNEFCVLAAGNHFLAECGFFGALAGDGTQEVGYFWSRALDWPLVWDQEQETAVRSPHGGPKITWGGPPLRPKVGRNRMRFHLGVVGDGQAELARLVTLGATHRGSQADRELLADPDGNEFCLLRLAPV